MKKHVIFKPVLSILVFSIFTFIACNSNTNNSISDEVIAAEDSFSVEAGGSISIPTGNLTSNDVNGNKPPLTVTEVNSAEGGTVQLNSDTVTFTSTGNAGDPASFHYIVENAEGKADTGTVTLTVTTASSGGDSGGGESRLVAYDDTWSIYAGKSATIPAANLLANDIDQTENPPVVIQSVGNAVNGAVSYNSSTGIIMFTSTGTAGVNASFTYTAINDAGNTDEATVVLTVEAAPSLIANADTFEVMQGQSCYIVASNLISNDEGDGTISLVEIGSPVGGTVSRNGDNITFTSTGYAYSPAGFSYTIEDSLGTTASGSVYINVTPLSAIEAYIYDDLAELDAMKNSYVPPSVQDIFNTWARFNGNNYYADKTAAEAAHDTNATAWEFLTNPDRVSMPLNVDPYNGFVSGESLENYTLEATLTSTDSDNDTIGLVIAFVREGSTNYILSALRTQGGTEPASGWGITYGTGETGADYNSVEWIISEKAVGTVSGRWSSSKSRVKIVRNGDIIKCYTTEWNDENNYQASSEIVIDLTSDSRLAKFRSAKPYGYSTFSQPYSTYLDINFTGGINVSKLYDTVNNQVWEYIQGTGWTLMEVTIQQDLGFVREVTNPDTGKTFLIKQNSIELVE